MVFKYFFLIILFVSCTSDDSISEEPQTFEELIIGNWKLIGVNYIGTPIDPDNGVLKVVTAFAKEISENSSMEFTSTGTFSQSFQFIFDTVFIETDGDESIFNFNIEIDVENGLYEFTSNENLSLDNQNEEPPAFAVIETLDDNLLTYTAIDENSTVFLNSDEVDVIASVEYRFERID